MNIFGLSINIFILEALTEPQFT